MSNNSIYTKELTIIGLIVSFIVLIIMLFSESYEEKRCKIAERIKVSSITGIIVNKEIDKTNHNSPIIWYTNNKNEKMQLFYFFYDFYEYVSINDTITKKANSNIILVKNKSKKKSFILDLDCE